MNQKYKELWIKALRSGEYKQGTGVLCIIKDEEGKEVMSRDIRDIEEGYSRNYCCLGVLNNVVNKEENIAILISGGWLKDNIANIVKLEWEQQTKLSTLNDKERYTFEQIADYIEKNL